MFKMFIRLNKILYKRAFICSKSLKEWFNRDRKGNGNVRKTLELLTHSKLNGASLYFDPRFGNLRN